MDEHFNSVHILQNTNNHLTHLRIVGGVLPSSPASLNRDVCYPVEVSEWIWMWCTWPESVWIKEQLAELSSYVLVVDLPTFNIRLFNYPSGRVWFIPF